MRKIFPVLLMGFLSVLFAEIFSGSSNVWFLGGWGWLMLLPLYMFHTVFFVYLALRYEKISIRQLYLFGMIFGLYESWITKVLWAGYLGSTSAAFTGILGIAIPEFLILVFFWHPIMSFLIPVLSFEILTKKIPLAHERLLTRTPKKTVLIILLLLMSSTFIAYNNKFNLIIENAALIGTIALIFGAYLLSKKQNIDAFRFNKWVFILISIYLAILYLVSFIYILPSKIPATIFSYAVIVGFYALFVFLILKSGNTETKLIKAKNSIYSAKHLLIFAIIEFAAVNLASFVPGISSIILVVSYYSLTLLGVILFVSVLISFVRRLISGKTQKPK